MLSSEWNIIIRLDFVVDLQAFSLSCLYRWTPHNSITWKISVALSYFAYKPYNKQNRMINHNHHSNVLVKKWWWRLHLVTRHVFGFVFTFKISVNNQIYQREKSVYTKVSLPVMMTSQSLAQLVIFLTLS